MRALSLILLCAAGLAPAPARADAPAEAVLHQARAATQSVRSLTATVEFGSERGTVTGSAALRRPNLARIEIGTQLLIVADGRQAYLYVPGQKQYSIAPLKEGQPGIQVSVGEPIDSFFHPEQLDELPPGSTAKLAGDETIDGQVCDLVEVSYSTGNRLSSRYAVARSDHFLRRVETVDRDGSGQPVRKSVRFKDLQLNPTLDAGRFTWNAPPGTQAVNPGDQFRAATASLLTIGSRAPDFTLPASTGGQVSLNSVLQGRKAAILCFWSGGNEATLALLRELVKLEAERGVGLAALLINLNDSAESVKSVTMPLGNHPRILIGGPVASSSVARAYGLRAAPTVYVLRADGTVLWRGLGWDTAAVQDALTLVGLGPAQRL